MQPPLEAASLRLSRATGKPKWRMDVKGDHGLVSHDGDLLATTSDARVLRIDTFKRRVRWQTTLPAKQGALFEPTVVREIHGSRAEPRCLILAISRRGQPLRRFDPGAGFQRKADLRKRYTVRSG